jgi:starvation-inducible DNA-binding protein
MKLKNIHWNITGLHFKTIHDYSQGLFEHFIESQDLFAELLKSQNQDIIISLEEIKKVSNIKETQSVNFSLNEKQALEIIVKDLTILKNQLYDLRGVADVDANYTAASLLEDEMIFVDKQIWFVSSMLK